MLARDAIKSANERREAAERERVEDKERYEALLREKDSEIAELRAEIEHRNNGSASNGGRISHQPSLNQAPANWPGLFLFPRKELPVAML